MRFLVMVAIVALAAPGAAQPPAGEGNGQIAWETSYDQAMQRARKERLPIMVAIVLKGEPANEAICAEHFQDQEIVALSRKFVCLLAFAVHASADADGGTESSDAMLKRLEPRVSLKQLVEVEKEVRFELLEAGEVSAPQFIFLRDDGRSLLLRHVWTLPKDELLRKMQCACHYFDPSSPAPESVTAEVAEVTALLERCNDNNMMTRREAMAELAQKEHPQVIDFLIRQTGREVEIQRRLEAIRAMGQAGQARFLGRLHEMLKEPDYQIRGNVANALAAVGLVESASPLAGAIKKERKEDVRSLLVRALVKCAPEGKDTDAVLKKLLKQGTPTDQITALWVLAQGRRDADSDKLALACAKASQDGVRTAAYYYIGRHKLGGAAKALKERLSSERQATLKACRWALVQLGEEGGGDAEDPSGEVSQLLPSAAY